MSEHTAGKRGRSRLVCLAMAVLIGGWQGGKSLDLISLAEAADPPSGLEKGPWILTDQDRREVTRGSFKAKIAVMFFGYRYCPDVCPTELQTIAAALDLLGADAGQVQPLFVSVDPERDTPERLKEYTTLFDPRILGLTGTPEQIRKAARSYRSWPDRSQPGPDGHLGECLYDDGARPPRHRFRDVARSRSSQ